MAETTTKERPINLKAWEVKALMDGRLTQLRRRIKPYGDYLGSGGKANREEWDDPKCWGWEDPEDPGSFIVLSRDPDSGDKSSKCPYGNPGVRLWVRETWALVRWEEEDIKDWLGDISIECLTLGWQVDFKSGSNYASDCFEDRGFRWRSPLSMPRWASRITLEITGLGVERIQGISIEDVIAVGVPLVENGPHANQYWREETGAKFVSLWDRDNGPGSWDRNEWAWVIGVRRLEGGNG